MNSNPISYHGMIVVRVDLRVIQPAGVQVSKFLGGSIGPAERATKPDLELEPAVKVLEERGYSVRRWPGGARAWYGAPTPVRSRERAKELELDLRRNPRPELADLAEPLDLSFDL
jgi:hypothetical protein